MDKKPIVPTIPALSAEDLAKATVQATNMPLMYFNHARMATSNFDLRIFLGIGNITPQGQQSVTEQLCVVLTPEFASTFVETMKVTLERYEELFGKIRPTKSNLVPPSSTQHKRKPS